MKCQECNMERDDFSRMRVEIVDKKTREIIEIVFCEVLCVSCIQKRYKNRERLRIYV